MTSDLVVVISFSIFLAHILIYIRSHVILAVWEISLAYYTIYTTPPRYRETARSSRSSTSTHQTPHETTSAPRGVTSYRPSRWPAPERHVLAIINFQDLAWQIYRLASSLLPTMSTFSTLNAGLTSEPSRRFPYSLGVAILITVKFHMFSSAIYAISFRLEFAKLGTSAFQDTLWNFVVPIIWEKPFKLMKNSASERRWKPGFLAGVPFNRRLSIPNCFLDVHDDLLFGACLAIAKFLASFCHDTLAAAPDEKTLSTSSIHFHPSVSCFHSCLYNAGFPFLCHCISHLYHTRKILAFFIKLWLWVTNVTQPWRDFLGQHLTVLLPIRELRDPPTPT